MNIVETLKTHYPSCTKLFDQILETKKSEEWYKEKYAKELERKK